MCVCECVCVYVCVHACVCVCVCVCVCACKIKPNTLKAFTLHNYHYYYVDVIMCSIILDGLTSTLLWYFIRVHVLKKAEQVSNFHFITSVKVS